MNRNENICKAVITVLSCLTFQRLTPEEEASSRKQLAGLIRDMDKSGIPWKLQNALFFIAEKYDARAWYLDQLLYMALARANMEAVPA